MLEMILNRSHNILACLLTKLIIQIIHMYNGIASLDIGIDKTQKESWINIAQSFLNFFLTIT